MAIVQGQLQHMLVNEQLRKFEDFMLKILNISNYSLVSSTKKLCFEKKTSFFSFFLCENFIILISSIISVEAAKAPHGMYTRWGVKIE